MPNSEMPRLTKGEAYPLASSAFKKATMPEKQETKIDLKAFVAEPLAA